MSSTPLRAPLFEFSHVDVLRGGREVMHDLNLRVDDGEHVAVVGPNGAGKSTLLKLITRECYPVPSADMVCRIFGRELWNVFDLRADLGIVSNDLADNLSGSARVREIVLSGFFSSWSLEPGHAVTGAMREACDRALEGLGIAQLAERRLDELSSGEVRRAAIARAFVHRPRALVFDEPSNSLDIAAQRDVREAMRTLARAGLAIVLVTHDLPDVVPEIERVVLLRDGRVWRDGRKDEVLTAAHLSELFGVSVQLAREGGYYHAR
jgi:iron complex transport system ATP-binding protein